MKNVHIIYLLGGAAALAYFASQRKGRLPTALVAGKPAAAPSSSSSMFLFNQPDYSYGAGGACFDRSGAQVDVRRCAADPGNLEGYFSSSALSDAEYRTSYDHGHSHNVPCCSGCAHGNGCKG